MVIDTGQEAPTFKLPVVDRDESRALAEALEKGPAIITFYKSSCQASQTLLPLLTHLANHATDDALTVWGVSLDPDRVTSNFVQQFGLAYPNLVHDEKGYPIARSYGVVETPTTLLIGQDGAVVWTGVAFSKADLGELSDKVSGLTGRAVDGVLAGARDIPDSLPG